MAKKVIRITESQLRERIQLILNEQLAPTSGSTVNRTPAPTSGTTSPTKFIPGVKSLPVMRIKGKAMQYLQNDSPEYHLTLGMKPEELKYPFRYSVDRKSPSSFGVGSDEIKRYVDYLNVYGKVPGTGIPIPYEGDDLRQMIEFLRGNSVASRHGIYGGVEERTTEGRDGKIYPVVEAIRAMYRSKSGRSLWSSLQKKMTDSEDDMKYKREITSILLNAYQLWIDSANGKDLNP